MTETEIGTYEGRTAAQWRQEAQASRQRSADSFARCDTDGFLSQWASDSTARLNDAKARMAEQGGMAEFIALTNLAGELVPAKMVQGQYGACWMLLDGHGRCAGWVSGNAVPAKRATINAKGYDLAMVRVPAGVDLGGKGYTLSVYEFRRDGGFSADAEIVKTPNEFWADVAAAKAASKARQAAWAG